jgi:hypothetical protein
MKVMKKRHIANESKLKQIMNERLIHESLNAGPFAVQLFWAFQTVS